MNAHRILLVDDDEGVRDAMSTFLTRSGYSVDVAESGETALRRLGETRPDLVVSDLKMPGISGVELLERVRGDGNSVPFVLLTAFGSVETAVTAMKRGAKDFLMKPFLPSRLEQIIRECLSDRSAPGAGPEAEGPREEIVARDKGMRNAMAMARHVAGGHATVLITGESGTGKEVLARHIHAMGRNPQAPFVAVNCAAIPEGLLESEMFGHEKGSFTGAGTRKIGKFEQASGGTLLLDEIGEMDIRLQAKLLRVLQEKSFERVGGTDSLFVTLRVIATTNRDLRDAVARGKFREDLFFRLNVVPIALPPLRERPDDILPLAEHFARKYAAEYGRPVPVFSDAVRGFLASLPYRGNVRELMNRVERAVILTPGGPIAPEALSYPEEPAGEFTPPQDPPVASPTKSVRDMEKALILATLRKTEGNRNRAAAELGISVRTLRNKIHSYRECGEAIP